MRETTSIMLWMLLFLLLITFWVDLRIRGLREEFLRHCLLMERCISATSKQGAMKPYTTDAREPSMDRTLHAPWGADMAGNISSSAPLPQFIDDIVPTKDELARALRGVDSLASTTAPNPSALGPSFDGYEGTLYAPVFPPSMTR